MPEPYDVDIPVVRLERLEAIVGPQATLALVDAARDLRDAFAGRTLWNINSTASGGGVAEMLQVLVGYAQGAGIAARWTVIDGDGGFFLITKRIHHWLHGADGDGGELGPRETAHYAAIMQDNARRLRGRVKPGDVVIVHDPQTAGLIPELKLLGASVVWRCHIGATTINSRTDEAWAFLRPYIDLADAAVFSRAAYVPSWLATNNVSVIPPSIDPFSPKNQHLDDMNVRAITNHLGLIDDPSVTTTGRFLRRDNTVGEVVRRADIVSQGRSPSANVPLIVQVSRWDPLKDMAGVMDAFTLHASGNDAHLALVGPSVSGVSDDPEGSRVLADCTTKWSDLPSSLRGRIMLVSLPMTDVDENAAMVNAIQRHATVVVQKSLAEGFGLTVAEAMWKHRAVAASAVGGIPDQISPGTGVLFRNPRDLDAIGQDIMQLIADPGRRAELGAAAHERIRTHFVAHRHLIQYAELLTNLIQ
jgi:trehalose synthase